MRYDDAAVPLGALWSSPFAKWQGTLAETSSLDLAAAVTTRALADRALDPAELAGLVLGWTVPAPDVFYGAPTLAARLGMPGVTGPMVSQACATSVAALHAAALTGGPQLVVATDRTSNGPTLSWPAPARQGGAPVTSHWVLDAFARDPGTGEGMLATGETVAAESGFTRDEADAVAVLRSEQYVAGLASQHRYLVPVAIPGRRSAVELAADEGVRPVDAGTAAKLPPATPEGIHTFASQTHPADGCAGAVVTSVDHARSRGGGVVRLVASGFARVAPAHMPQAPVPAARAALADAGWGFGDLHAVTTHNPFAVNDLYLARETGIALEDMNVRGCSLVFGHPQGPTGLRSIAELVETLVDRGGGRGLFTGCAAGDTGAALVVEVDT
ncbi:thiolase family protein [Actinomycetospora flava]|uniref:Probable acetyl-CoA acetyltransferase n=1 Tax=Actinomycetospora flava TaxID=3129232 RepID=A0ABU8M2Z1_9PSEU